MKIIVLIFSLLATIAFSNDIAPKVPATDSSAFRLVTADILPVLTTATNTNDIIPQISFQEVPITSAIENLARAANINYYLDPFTCKPLIGSAKDGMVEPLVTFHINNVTARETLDRMLNLRGFVLLDNPVSHVSRITRAGQTMPVMDLKALNLDTNNSIPITNDILPEIRFSDVPLEIGLENLGVLFDHKIQLDPSLTGQNIVNHQQLLLNLHWRNLSAKQALIAICEIYDLTISEGDTTNVIQIEPRAVKHRHGVHLH